MKKETKAEDTSDIFQKMEAFSVKRKIFLDEVGDNIKKIEDFLEIHPGIVFQCLGHVLGMFKTPEKYCLAKKSNVTRVALPIIELPVPERLEAYYILVDGIGDFFKKEDANRKEQDNG